MSVTIDTLRHRAQIHGLKIIEDPKRGYFLYNPSSLAECLFDYTTDTAKLEGYLDTIDAQAKKRLQ